MQMGEAYCTSTVDPASNLITHGIAEGMGHDEERDALFLDQLVSMLREGRLVQLLSGTTGGELDRSVRYHEILKPLGLGYEMGGAFIDGSLWGGMDLIREIARPDFSDREVELVKRIAPHVGAGFKAAALRSRASTGQGTADAPGVLNLDRSGSVVSHTSSAERWLRDLA